MARFAGCLPRWPLVLLFLVLPSTVVAQTESTDRESIGVSYARPFSVWTLGVEAGSAALLPRTEVRALALFHNVDAAQRVADRTGWISQVSVASFLDLVADDLRVGLELGSRFVDRNDLDLQYDLFLRPGVRLSAGEPDRVLVEAEGWLGVQRRWSEFGSQWARSNRWELTVSHQSLYLRVAHEDGPGTGQWFGFGGMAQISIGWRWFR